MNVKEYFISPYTKFEKQVIDAFSPVLQSGTRCKVHWIVIDSETGYVVAQHTECPLEGCDCGGYYSVVNDVDALGEFERDEEDRDVVSPIRMRVYNVQTGWNWYLELLKNTTAPDVLESDYSKWLNEH